VTAMYKVKTAEDVAAEIKTAEDVTAENTTA
jgi:hypothetical protein